MLINKLQKKQRSEQRIIRRFKRLTLTFVVVLGFQCIFSNYQEDINNSFFAQADGVFIPEFEDDHRLLGATSAELQVNSASLVVKGYRHQVKDKTLKACTGKIVTVDGEKLDKCFDGSYYAQFTQIKNKNGFVEEYYTGEHCSNPLVQVPGTSLMGNGVQGVGYFFFLLYLFLGISINADIFMESIEVITSSTKEMCVEGENGEVYKVQVAFWNPTVANLTLLALGSSAPEILLSVIESLKDLGGPAGVLGPASIVGSGAFNLFVITGISIMSVGDEPKLIYDLGVYATTATFSLFAYSWMYFCLLLNTPDVVDLNEAWLTLFFFVLLVGLSFAADKYKQKSDQRKDTVDQKIENVAKQVMQVKKSQLRQFAQIYGKEAIIQVARNNYVQSVNNVDKQTIVNLFSAILGSDDLMDITPDQLIEVIEPDSLLEKFAYKKANKIGKQPDTFEMKGQKGQIENNAPVQNSQNNNDLMGFKCLHYSVLESSIQVELTIVQKEKNSEIEFGVRTVKDNAIEGSDYKPIDQKHKFTDGDLKVYVQIVDNDQWEPDLDFLVELYDLQSGKRLQGDDTQTRVTILDEDSPGIIGFEITTVSVSKSQDSVEILLTRQKGSDGKVSCNVKTEVLNKEEDIDQNAKANVDFSPLDSNVIFESGETKKKIKVELLNPVNNVECSSIVEQTQEDEVEKMFKIVLSEPKPDELKISSKNVCIVTILQESDSDQLVIREQALLQYYFDQQEPTWGQQFKNAVLLGPSVDEDDLIIASPSFSDAMMHFLLITWKIFFSIIPPVKTGGGFPAFFIALGLVGAITAIVGDVAELLGCVLSIPPAITAITLVALGTSVPDTFASVTAAQGSEYADSAVGNVTGSNSVNIFLGLGLPWVICAQYGASTNKPYVVPAGKLAFTVAVFLVCSVITFVILTARRVFIGGELGGPMTSKVISGGTCFLLWIVYITLSILQQLGVIE